eukprot:GILJ01037542.1.p1 GENE.GILJ01037542.1~~GILJ01037542.1.p1  ORF type:complete len:358 (-),score=29.37 GILJ01037542.1:97-1071(-)
MTSFDPMFSLTNDAQIMLLGSYPLRGLDDPVQLYQIQPRAATRTYPSLRLHVENAVQSSSGTETNSTFPTGTGTSNNFNLTRKLSTAVGSHTTTPSIYQSTLGVVGGHPLNQSDRYSATGTQNGDGAKSEAELLVLNFLRKDRSTGDRRHEQRVSVVSQDNRLSKAELLFGYTFLQSVLATTPASFQTSALKQLVESWGLSKSELKASKANERRRNKIFVELAAKVARVCKVKGSGLKVKQSQQQSHQGSISVGSSYHTGQTGQSVAHSQRTQLGPFLQGQTSTYGFNGSAQVALTEMTPTNARSGMSFPSRAQSVRIEQLTSQ